MNVVWLVQEGQYDNTITHCAAPDEETAQAIADNMNVDHYTHAYVESVPLRTDKPNRRRVKVKR